MCAHERERESVLTHTTTQKCTTTDPKLTKPKLHAPSHETPNKDHAFFFSLSLSLFIRFDVKDLKEEVVEEEEEEEIQRVLQDVHGARARLFGRSFVLVFFICRVSSRFSRVSSSRSSSSSSSSSFFIVLCLSR